MTFLIAGLGTALPKHAIYQHEAAKAAAALCCPTDELRSRLVEVYSRTGVESRHSVLLETSSNSHPGHQSFYGHYAQQPRGPSTAARMDRYKSHAGPLALDAARCALEEAAISPQQITHLITVSCSGFFAPGFDVQLIEQLPLPAGTARTHIGFMGCHAAINGLRVAQAFAQADPAARVLLCAVELCSLHHQYELRADQLIANALFADGAAAVVGRHAADRSTSDWQLTATGSTMLPDSAEMMTWSIGDHGFEMSLSKHVPQMIWQHLAPWLDQWLATHHLQRDAIRSWAVHPGGPRILEAAAAAVGVAFSALEHSQRVLAECGNMSSPTLLFILQRLRRAGATRPCVALAFGPGLTVEAALFV